MYQFELETYAVVLCHLAKYYCVIHQVVRNYYKAHLLQEGRVIAECAFSAVADILTKKHVSLNVIDRGNLRLNLTKLIPSIKTLDDRHQHNNLL